MPMMPIVVAALEVVDGACVGGALVAVAFAESVGGAVAVLVAFAWRLLLRRRLLDSVRWSRWRRLR